MIRARRRALAVALSGAIGCGGSPQPIPPPDLDTVSAEIRTDGILLRGAPGTVSEEADSILLMNFAFSSGQSHQATVPVASDGSFAYLLPGALPEDALRMHALAQATLAHSTPLDFTTREGGALALRPATPCVSLGPADVTLTTPRDQPASVTLALENGCGQPLDILLASLWFGSPGWSEIPSPAPFSMADGEMRSFAVRLESGTAGATHDAFVVKVTTFEEVRAVTLFGRVE
jgi:hypothetical protein